MEKHQQPKILIIWGVPKIIPEHSCSRHKAFPEISLIQTILNGISQHKPESQSEFSS